MLFETVATNLKLIFSEYFQIFSWAMFWVWFSFRIMSKCSSVYFSPVFRHRVVLRTFGQLSWVATWIYPFQWQQSAHFQHLVNIFFNFFLNYSCFNRKLQFFLVAMMPLWIFTLGTTIFDRGELRVPYFRIGIMALGLIVPLIIGLLIQRYLPRLAKLLVRILKTCSSLLIIFIVIFAIVTNLYLFKLFTWQVSSYVTFITHPVIS